MCTHAYRDTGTDTRAHMDPHVHTQTHAQTHVHTGTHAQTHMHTWTHMCTHRHVHTGTHAQTHVHTQGHTRTHTAALRWVLFPLRTWVLPRHPRAERGPRTRPDLPCRRGLRALTRSCPPGCRQRQRPHKGAGPVGTDLPGPGGGAGTERPHGAAGLGLQQQGQRRRWGAGACFTGQESPGWGFRPPQAGPTPTPHLLGGLGWALLPPSVLAGRRGGRPPQRLRAQPGQGRGSRAPKPPPGAAAGLAGGSQPCLGAPSRQMTQGPSRATGQRGRARWRADPGSA